MKYSDQTYNLRIELDTEKCELTQSEIEKIEGTLTPLREAIKNFPVSVLYVTIQYYPPSEHYRVKSVLRLPGKSLPTGDLDEHMYPAFKRCVNKLIHNVTAYKDELENADAVAKHEKGTRHDIVAKREVDGDAVREAVEQGSYGQFRELMFPYEEPVRKRVGRWIQRYPKLDAQLGTDFDLSDLVEEVFLLAFERYDQLPREVPFGDWLESLIDPAVRLMSDQTDRELSNVSFAKTAVETERLRKS